MCTFVYVRFVIRFLSFFAPLGPLRLIIAWHFPKKCVNAAMPQCRGLVRTLISVSKWLFSCFDLSILVVLLTCVCV